MSRRRLVPTLLLVGALPILWATTAFGDSLEDGGVAREGSPTSRFLETLTVIATRTERSIGEVAGTVTVIDRHEIETRLVQDVRDLVRYEPGVSVEGSASQFGFGGFNIRGIGGNRVLTRVDGVPLAEEFEFGHFEMPPSAVGIDSIERVEILRGSASALYGSDALGGVVSVETRDPRHLLAGEDGSAIRLHTAWDGRDQGVSEAITWAGRGSAWQGSVSVDHSSAHERGTQGSVDTADASRTEPDPQRRQRLGLLGKLVRTRSPSNEFEVGIEALERRAETDVLSSRGTTNLGVIFGFGPEVTYLVEKPAVNAVDEQRRWRLSLEQSLTGGAADHLLWRLYTHSNETDQETQEIRRTSRGGGPFGAPTTNEVLRTGLMRFEQDSLGGELQIRRAADRSLFTFGATLNIDRFDQLRDRPETDLETGALLPSSDGLHFPTKYFPQSEVREAGLFAQAEVGLLGGRLSLTPGLRYDRNDLVIDRRDEIFLSGNLGTQPPVELQESSLSPKLGMVAALGKGVTLHVQYTHGFRAPPYSAVNSGFTHLAGGQTRLPNPELRAESSDGFELGLRRAGTRASFSVTAFSTDYRAFIELVALGFNPSSGLTEFQQRNVTRARICGVEAAARMDLGRLWRLRASGAWIEGEDRSQSVPLNSIQPPQMVVGLARESKDQTWRAELAGRWSSAKSLADLDRRSFPQFAAQSSEVLDLYFGWRVSTSLSLDAGVTNLLDETYWSWANALGLRENSISLERHTETGRSASISLRYRR